MRSRQAFPAPADIRHYLGAWSAVSVMQFFLAEAVAALRWAGPQPYSLTDNFISDLGAAHCAVHEGRSVCSPLNWLMNASFVLQGLGMLIAAVLITSAVLQVAARPAAAFRLDRRPVEALAVRILLGIAGAGLVVVGLVPEDVLAPLHLTGAGLYFGGGSLALVVLGAQWRQRAPAGWAVLALGIVAFVSTLIGAITRLHVPLPGLLERFMAYPITFGIAVMGAVIYAGARSTRAEVRRLRAARPAAGAG